MPASARGRGGGQRRSGAASGHAIDVRGLLGLATSRSCWGADVAARDVNGSTALYKAVRCGADDDRASAAVGAGALIETADAFGETHCLSRRNGARRMVGCCVKV